MKPIDNFDQIFKNKQKILAVFAHPDDAELYAGGTIARLLDQGKEVRVIKVTFGNKGSRQEKISQGELKKLRFQEDQAAMEELGIEDNNNIYLDFDDGTVENSHQVIASIAHQIRIFHPNVIITHNPENVIIRFSKDVNWVNHRDHRNTGLSTIDAAYPYSRDILFLPEQLQNRAISHTCTEFLLIDYIDYYDHPDLVHFEVTDFIDKRIAAHAKHSSQYSLKAAQESADFFTIIKDTDKRYERFRYVIAD